MALQTLPLELMESIADKIDSGADLSAFSRTSRHLNKILDPRLYAFYARRGSDKALFFSIAEGYCSVLNKTIQSGADLNSLHEWLPGARFTTPLAFAAGTGHVEIVKLLLKHGANPNPARWREIQQTPLSVAAGRGNYEIAKILIEAGADVHTTVGVESGSLALYAAACCSDQDDNLVRLLLDKGVLDVSPQEYKGTCALESAIQCGNPSTVKLLLQAGANPVFKTSDGLTPAMLAMEVGSEDLAFLFLETGADLEQTCDRGQGLVWDFEPLISIIGGPAGYVLIVNIMVSEIVEPIRRTSVFGKLQGCIMLGQGVGYLAGGMIGDVFGIQRPFEAAFVCFLLATLYARVALPYLAPEATFDNHTVNRGASEFFRPLKILLPQRVRLQSCRTVKHYGVLFLCCGVFLGVLATDYAPFMIQMYATAEFDFNQAENGWLMSGWAVMRSIFLLLLFPYIITRGRTWFASSGSDGVSNTNEQPSGTTPYYEDFDTLMESRESSEPISTQSSDPDINHLGFDLFFLRWSLVIDGALTTIAAFATHRWHIYLGSGSAPAAKGVITDMCFSSQRADALNAITLVENIARLATQGFFGILFAFFAGAGKAYLTFFCNAAIALLGMGVLLWCHFPPLGSQAMEEEDVIDGTSGGERYAQGSSRG
ncbi:hypothetical protein CDV31_000934 [Fusarium ambrosium]|uniref:Uncharacterized protein n=1 Tax=Fusarium ambrosium TaxID=131363 RepID=A0A428V0R9_9HYPO|nr:hypothetical protein CDV31_000934 [Fusarium ambrosium]